MEPAMTDLFAVLGALGASFTLGFVKKHTTALDEKFGRFVKPFQPAFVLAAGIGLPYLTSALQITPVDPSVFAYAPLATIATVTAHEVTSRLTGRRK